MDSAIKLPARRYTILDSVGIAFRSAPVAAFFYGFFDLATAALTPIVALVAARFFNLVMNKAPSGSQPPRRVSCTLGRKTRSTRK